jgi:hypothetical protein
LGPVASSAVSLWMKEKRSGVAMARIRSARKITEPLSSETTSGSSAAISLSIRFSEGVDARGNGRRVVDAFDARRGHAVVTSAAQTVCDPLPRIEPEAFVDGDSGNPCDLVSDAEQRQAIALGARHARVDQDVLQASRTQTTQGPQAIAVAAVAHRERGNVGEGQTGPPWRALEHPTARPPSDALRG